MPLFSFPEALHLHQNQFVDKIPDAIYDLGSLVSIGAGEPSSAVISASHFCYTQTSLRLDKNELTGTISGALANLSNLSE